MEVVLANFLNDWLDQHELHTCEELARAVLVFLGPQLACHCENQTPHPCHCTVLADGTKNHFAMCDWANIQRNEYLAENAMNALARIEFECQEVEKAAVLGRFGDAMKRVHIGDLRKIYAGVALPEYKPPAHVE